MRGLYIHIPFCVKKCNYCDFISFTNCENKHEDYINMLIQEMQEYKKEQVDTIFIGGGTPTILSPYLLNKLLVSIRDNFDISKNCEFTIEANPKTIDDEKVNILLLNGINRISVGVQSFNDDELISIGRIHNSDDVYNTVCDIKKMGLSNINIDLMSALPNQTLEKFKHSLERAVEINPTHISCYSLIIEDNTPLEKAYSKGEITVPNEEDDRAMYSFACEFLEKQGYHQYEISNFAKKGYECQHNIKYWECREYIGLGISAHSYIGDNRFYNTSDLSKYLSGQIRTKDITNLTSRGKQEEFMMMGLRMIKGVHECEFFDRFGVKIEKVYGDILKKYVDLGFMIHENKRYFLSGEGISISNSIMCEFIF